MNRSLVLLVLGVLALGAIGGMRVPLVGAAHSVLLPASFGAITEFALPTASSSPSDICMGPDGNLWFTEFATGRIGRISRVGAIAEFATLTLNSGPTGITLGPDGNLWFTESTVNKIGRISPLGEITEFTVPTSDSHPRAITSGPDGNLWFTEQASQIGRITPLGVIVEFPIPAGPDPNAQGITAGSDGNLWFAEETRDKIGKITPLGVITEYPIPTADSQPRDIIAGPDGNFWFTEYHANQIGRITPLGAVTEFAAGQSSGAPVSITLGADGNLWFTNPPSNSIGRITPSGMVLLLAVPTGSSGLAGITAGPDQNIWFTEYQANKIGRLDLDIPTATPTTTAIHSPTPSATHTPLPSVTATSALPSTTATRTALPGTTPTGTALPPSSTSTPVPSTVSATPTVTNVWIARAPYPIPIDEAAVVAQGGLLYSFGGHTTSGTTAAAYRYDPAGDNWLGIQSLPEPQAGLSAVSDGTFIYLLNGERFSNHLYRYDPAAGVYTVLAAAPAGTYRQTAALVNGMIYRIGGQTSSSPTGVSSVEAYTIATNTWTTLPNYPKATYLSMSIGANGLLYGAGGAGTEDLLKTYRYDPATPGWDDLSVPELPQSRWGAASGVLGGKWVLAGGNADGTLTAGAVSWDLQPSHAWQALPPMLQARQKLSGAAIGFNFFAVGGENSVGTPTTNIQEYLAPCALQFSDVQLTDYFYTAVQYLACRGIIGGYNNGTFRPYNQTTRAQLAKIVVGGEDWLPVTPATAHFSDVPVGSTFYAFVETALAHGIISGYSDGTFRPGNPVTRGQLSKIIVGAQGWAVNLTGAPHFNDVAADNIFYPAIETAYNHGIISGYSDGTFRPANPATRGQIAKIVYLALQGGLAAENK